ncbi:MAG TPA: ferrochelatase [Elusimicrobia bacterium]|nr:ferrochelatase [Elusimicrobiota bacterium]
MNQQSKAAVLMMAYGAPKSLEEVPAFLKSILGPRATEAVLKDLTERYRRIGGASPVVETCAAVAEMLQTALRAGGFGVDVYLGMKHSEPSIRGAIQAMAKDGHASALALPLAPYQSGMTDEAYLEKARAAAAEAGGLALFSPPPWNAHPMLTGAFAEKLKASFEEIPGDLRRRTLTLFTGHSLPQSVADDGDPYAEQLQLTAAATAQEAGVAEWMLAYQSVPQGAEGGWLGPDAGEIIDMAAKGGMKAVLLDPVGFLFENLETLYDLDVVYRERAERQGLKFYRVPALNDDPLFVCALAAITRSAFAPLS